MKKMVLHKKLILFFLTTILFFSGCASKPETNAGIDDLDYTIRTASDYLNTKLEDGIKIVFLNFQSDSPALSGYVIDELTENTVNDGLFTVVDRANLEIIRAEMNFQLSGDVSDDTAQAIGKILGAQTIVSGGISRFGSSFRLRLRAISVETAEIQAQFNHDITNTARILDLLQDVSLYATVPNTTKQNTNLSAASSQPQRPVYALGEEDTSTEAGQVAALERFKPFYNEYLLDISILSVEMPSKPNSKGAYPVKLIWEAKDNIDTVRAYTDVLKSFTRGTEYTFSYYPSSYAAKAQNFQYKILGKAHRMQRELYNDKGVVFTLFDKSGLPVDTYQQLHVEFELHYDSMGKRHKTWEHTFVLTEEAYREIRDIRMTSKNGFVKK
jgi:hypothetical protein